LIGRVVALLLSRATFSNVTAESTCSMGMQLDAASTLCNMLLRRVTNIHIDTKFTHLFLLMGFLHLQEASTIEF
jgi:hypothetical protein